VQPPMDDLQEFHVLAGEMFKTSDSAERTRIMEQARSLNTSISQSNLASWSIKVESRRRSKMLQEFLEKGESYLDQQLEHVDKILRDTKASKDRVRRAKKDRSFIRSFRESVPRIVHFIKSDNDASNFPLLWYLAVRSAFEKIKPDVIMFHSPVSPSGYWWERSKPFLKLTPIHQLPSHIGGKPIGLVAHAADLIRLELLDKYGGVYMDLDVISVNSFDPLFRYPFTVGLEKAVSGYEEVASNAVIISRPKEYFLELMARNQASQFYPSDCYACHSVVMLRDLALRYSEIPKVVDYRGFAYPGWEEAAYYSLFASANPSDLDLSKTFAIHLFQSNGNMSPYREMLDETYIKAHDSNFNRIVRDYF